MKVSLFKKRKHITKLHTIFLLSALFFAFFSFFGVYSYKIYSVFWFIMFFVYELLFYCGLRSGRVIFITPETIKKKKKKASFKITEAGAAVLWTVCLLSLFSFIFFLYSYLTTVGRFVFGSFTAEVFQEGRGTFEKISLMLMQLGGDGAFLVLSADKTSKHKYLKTLSSVTLFLPGLRYLLLGARYALAVELLLFIIIKMPSPEKLKRFKLRSKLQKLLILTAVIISGAVFMYMFSSRNIYYTVFEREIYHPGDMTVRPLWKTLYKWTNGGIESLFIASDYLGEAPFVFSNYCKYFMPENIACGRLTLRFFAQLFSFVFGTDGFLELTEDYAGGQYSGFAYTLIADFGVKLSFLFAFLFGRWFALIERYAKNNMFCHVIYPALKVICFFAPIYYFNVGRLDYTIIFALFLTAICLRRYHTNE